MIELGMLNYRGNREGPRKHITLIMVCNCKKWIVQDLDPRPLLVSGFALAT
jgi:hypothetical protein